jgi:hypothetical protein
MSMTTSDDETNVDRIKKFLIGGLQIHGPCVDDITHDHVSRSDDAVMPSTNFSLNVDIHDNAASFALSSWNLWTARCP